MVCWFIPGMLRSGTDTGWKGEELRLSPIVVLQWAPVDISSQLTPSHKWHLDRQLKPQFKWKALGPEPVSKSKEYSMISTTLNVFFKLFLYWIWNFPVASKDKASFFPVLEPRVFPEEHPVPFSSHANQPKRGATTNLGLKNWDKTSREGYDASK